MLQNIKNEKAKNSDTKKSDLKDADLLKESELVKVKEDFFAKVLGAAHEVKVATKDLDDFNINLEKNISKLSREFKTKIEEMQKNNIILYQVPKKIEAKIDQMIPAIAVELDKVCQEKVKEYSEIVKDTAKELNDLKNDMQVTHKGQIRKRFYGFLINILCAGVVAAAASYTVLQKYPSKVFLRNAKSVVVEGSEVSFWDSGKILLQDGKKSKKK